MPKWWISSTWALPESDDNNDDDNNDNDKHNSEDHNNDEGNNDANTVAV